jgi:hypothetical protein
MAGRNTAQIYHFFAERMRESPYQNVLAQTPLQPPPMRSTMIVTIEDRFTIAQTLPQAHGGAVCTGCIGVWKGGIACDPRSPHDGARWRPQAHIR